MTMRVRLGFNYNEETMTRQSREKVYRNAGNLPLLDMLPKRRGRVLDCGCGAGDNARILMSRGWVVTGITISPEEQQIASAYCDRVFISDLNSGVPDSVGDGYDIVLMSHVLEHLANPQELLREVKKRIAPDGVLAIAIPNVLFYPNRLRFIFGQFEYETTGVMDDTHLRFYTFSTGGKLLVANGYKVVRAEAEGAFPLWKVRSVIPLSFVSMLNRFVARHWPDLFGHQSLYLAQVVR